MYAIMSSSSSDVRYADLPEEIRHYEDEVDDTNTKEDHNLIMNCGSGDG